VVTATAATAVERAVGRFDVVFIDPPYGDADDEVAALVGAVGGVLAERGIVVVHRRAPSTIDLPDFLTCTDERRYGDAVVTMMERPAT
jgi:16S rRNA (guanine966-N2)-methyltransferase